MSDKEDTAIMPDVVMVCDKSKLDEYGCTGAPDMIVEVLSTSTARYDRTVKFNKYRQSGVREYWMVEPSIGVVWACSLDSGNYFVKAYGDEDIAPVDVLPGCEINLRDVFAK